MPVGSAAGVIVPRALNTAPSASVLPENERNTRFSSASVMTSSSIRRCWPSTVSCITV